MPAVAIAAFTRRRLQRVPIPTEGEPTGIPGSITIRRAADNQPLGAAVALTTSGSGNTLPLIAEVLDTVGHPIVGATVDWTSSDPGVASIDNNGVLVGVAPGTTVIDASVTGPNGGAVSATDCLCSVSVPAVATLEVSLATGSGTAGGTLGVTLTPKDAGGAVLPGRVVTASSSAPGVATGAVVGYVGTITFVGAGSATITWDCEGHTITTVVTVSAAGSVRPPGMSTVVDNAWDAGITPSNPAGGGTINGWYRYQTTGNQGRTIIDGSAPVHPNVLEIPKGGSQGTAAEHFNPGSAPGAINALGAFTRIFFQLPIYVPVGYIGSSSGVQKFIHTWARIDAAPNGQGGSCLVLAVVGSIGSSSNPLRIELRMQGCSIVNQPNGAGNGATSFNLSGPSLQRGTYYFVSVEGILNTLGNADGIARLWVNGTQFINTTNITYSAASVAKRWTDLQINPTYGGLGSVPSPPQTIRMGRVEIAVAA